MTKLIRRLKSWEWCLIVMAGAMLLWAFSMRIVDVNAMNDYGLISVLPVTYFVALIAVIGCLCLLIHRDEAPEAAFVVLMIALIVMLHSLSPILYGTLRYQWAYKHVGLVDYIIRHGSVDPTVFKLDAYHSWPGFFTLNALIVQVGGLGNSLGLGIWAETPFNILNLFALLIVFRALTDDRRLARLAILFFFLANWVGQDYYSPQALAYFLYLVIVGISLRWFRSALTLPLVDLSRWPRLQRGWDFVLSLLDRARSGTIPSEPADVFARAGLFVVVFLSAFSIISSHQLTPIMLVVAVTLLVMGNQINTRTLAAIVILLTGTWILFVASPFLGRSIQSMLNSAGQVSNNVNTNLVDLSTLSPGQRVVAIADRALTAGVCLMALAGGIRRLASGSVDLAAILLLVGPALTPLGGGYDGEILFRVYLFALPSAAFFAAAIFYPSGRHGRRWLWAASAFVLSILIVLGFFYASYGKEQRNRSTPDELAGSLYLYSTAPNPTLLIEGSANYPQYILNYEYFVPVPIASEPPESRDRVLKDPVGVLSNWMSNPHFAANYIIITRSQKVESDTLGEMPLGALDRLEQTLRASDKFTVVYQNPDVTIFALSKKPTGGAP